MKGRQLPVTHVAEVELSNFGDLDDPSAGVSANRTHDPEAPKIKRSDTTDSPRRLVSLASEDDRLQRASLYITNAIRGRLSTTDNPKLYLFFHGFVWNAVYLTAVMLLCVIIVFENPSTLWHYIVPQDSPYISIPFGELREDGTPGASVPLELSLFLNCFEIALCAIFYYDYHMRRELYASGNNKKYYEYTKKERNIKNRKTFDRSDTSMHIADLPIHVIGGDPLITNLWNNFELVLTCTIVLNCLICLITSAVYGVQVVPNFSRMLRPLFFMIKLVNVRQITTSIIRSIPKILDVVILLILTILMFAIIGFLMFSGVVGRYQPADSIFSAEENNTCLFSEGYKANVNASDFDSFVPYCSTWNSYCRDYFNSVAHAFIHLFILVTTANFPDVMNPYTECSGAAFIFFAIYLVICLYTFLSLVLAVVYNLYQRVASAQISRRRSKAQRSLWKAFELLNEPVVPAANVRRAKVHGAGASQKNLTDLDYTNEFGVGSLVDRGVVHFHKRFKVHNYVQWLRARVTAVRRDDTGILTHVDLKYQLGNGMGPVEPLTAPDNDLEEEKHVPIRHIRHARGISLQTWLKLRDIPVRQV